MPQNWKTYKLGEVADICSSKRIFRSDYVDEGIIFYRSKEIIEKANGLSVSDDRLFISEKKFNEIKEKFGAPTEGDLLISAVGNRSGIPYIVKNEPEFYFKDGNLIWFRNIQENLNTTYLYYWFRSSIGQSTLQSIMIGSAQKALTIEGFRRLEVKLPALPEQRAIASILSSLDDKIELNLQMNKTLEEMAMTLYKHWFVDFEFPSSGGVVEDRGGQFPSSGGVDFIEDERRGGSFSSPAAEPAGRVGRNTTNYMSLPYNPKLKERAKALRKAGNLAEVLFWQQVNKKQFMGLDFDRQKIIGNYIVDFYCANVNVVVEIDGSSHDNKQDYDAARDAYLEGLGLTVIHITDEAVKKDLAQTMEDLKAHPAFNSPPPEGWSKTGVVNSPPLEGWISSEMKDGVVLSRLQQQSPQGEVNSPPLEQSPQGEVVNNHPAFQGGVNNHPAFQAPLQGRGRGSAEVKGYKSSGGKFIDSELGPIPEGWEVKRLGDVIETLGGGTPKTTVDEYWENGTIDWYSPTDLTKANSLYSLGTAKKITELGLKKSSSKLFPKGSLLMSSRATIGAITINRKEACTNQGFITMIPNEKVSLYQLHGWTVANMDLIISKANGSTFKEISKSNFRDLLITVGVELDEYLRSVESIYSQIENNILENQTLTSLRDTLLPKLISGEVRVKDVESQVAEVL